MENGLPRRMLFLKCFKGLRAVFVRFSKQSLCRLPIHMLAPVMAMAVFSLPACSDQATSQTGGSSEQEANEGNGDGLTSRIDTGERTIELTTEQSSASIPLGIPMIPGAEVAYEMNSGVDGKLKYSGSFNTQMDMPEAMAFYSDALAEKGGTIERDDRKDGRSFQSIQGTLPEGAEFYVHVTDLKEKRGYTQVDLKLQDK